MFRIVFPDQVEDAARPLEVAQESIGRAAILQLKIIFGLILFFAGLGVLIAFGPSLGPQNPVIIVGVCVGGLVVLTVGMLAWLSRKSS